MYIDFKCSVWERINIPKEIEKEFIEKVKNGEIETSDDAFHYYGDNDSLELLTQFDTSESLSVFNNGGAPTLELFDNNKCIFDNGRKENK